MRLRKLHILLLAITFSVCVAPIPFTADEAVAATAAAKKKTTSKKKKTTKKKSTGKKTSSRKKTSRKKTRKKKVVSKTPVPQMEQPSNDSLTLAVNDSLLRWIPSQLNPGGLRVNRVSPDPKKRAASVSLNENFTYLPVTAQLIDSLSLKVAEALPDSMADYRISLTVNSKPLSYYITTVDKLPERFRRNIPFVVEENPDVHPTKGMEGDVVALWSSHGRYYKPGAGTWMWQRPLLFETVEDTYTMGYILPFVVPMLENAGAYVMLPRERDINSNEVIVDNDTNEGGMLFSQSFYHERTGKNKWTTGELDGFIYDLPDFRDTENPFENGTYRQTQTVRSEKDASLAAWYADIPADGEYAVYVSYKTLPESTSDALYTVNYSGGSKSFRVNQTMGGGTWIYLGTFPLEEGYSDTEPIVVLSSQTEKEAGKILTADAVKIGGGMGNIARSPKRADIFYDPSTPLTAETAPLTSEAGSAAASDDDEVTDEETADETADDETAGDENTDDETADDESVDDGSVDGGPAPQPVEPSRPKGPAPTFSTSGMPRYLEGARYWLHWAGFPESVYSPYHGSDDYKDDYTSRGHWVNYLAGGSRVLPDAQGLGIPVDVAFALHSDAGKRADDSFVGTLGIYYTNNGDSYTDGTPRSNSRTLTDMVMRQITGDIRKTYEPRWTRRSMWDKSYVEARVPEVPTTLIELMSHQNFADMRYGLDPSFRFTVSRAIYKALARFVAERKDREVVIQPLPVRDFAITRTKPGHYRLSWQPTPDSLESTAMPTRYIILERTADDLGFHRLEETKDTHIDLIVADNDIHSYRIIAANQGGVSFPSETLALRESPDRSEPVLVINGFDRVSGPGETNSDGRAGFVSETDFGVPYVRDISFVGHQTEFRRSAGEAHGRSDGNFATRVIAGNTFDYPYVHGLSIAAAGMGFVSASASAVENGYVKIEGYPVVDLILGKQRTTTVGNGMSGIKYRAMPPELRTALEKYTAGGGDLLVTGEYVADELFGLKASDADRSFGQVTLGIVPGSPAASDSGRVRTVAGAMGSDVAQRSLTYSSTLNDKTYIVESPDIILPAEGAEAGIVLTTTDSDSPVGVLARNGKSRTATFTVPFEAITDRAMRDALMAEILDYLKK